MQKYSFLKQDLAQSNLNTTSGYLHGYEVVEGLDPIFRFFLLFKYLQETYLHKVQGDPLQTVKSNLDLTERKHAINFNLKVDSDQGRLGI